ncbi:MAG: hypothetical protein ABI634_01270 [Acidobacteriota bacterium]
MLCSPRRRATIALVIVCATFSFGFPTLSAAQSPSAAAHRTDGALPDATFDVMFRKYGGPANVFAPFYSWDAHMALDLTVVRRGSHSVAFTAVFQTVGTENIAARVSVGGTGYILRAAYTRARSDQSSFSAGVSHLSSHLTRDLDDKTAELRAEGARIPDVMDADEYNVVYVQGFRRFPSSRFAPELTVSSQLLDFRFDGHVAAHARPVYAATRWTLWKGNGKAIMAETEHEIGKRSWNAFSLFVALPSAHHDADRLQIFVSASPGRGMHVSPNVAGLRDGIAVGVRMTFHD